MREILFKAKRIDNGEWVEGLLWKKKYQSNKWFISCFPDKDDNEEVYVIDINTLCQYTGLTDKNGNKIWENDVVKQTFEATNKNEWYCEDIYGDETGVVTITASKGVCIRRPYQNIWIDGEQTKRNERISKNKNVCQYRSEVIGNIFDNPELLGGC